MPRAEDGKDGFVLAVDPGGHTGVAWLAGEQFGSGVIDGGRFEFHRWFTNVVNTIGSPIAIVCENFIVTASTARKTAQPDPYLIIGWLELWSHQHGVPFTLQTPSTGKGFGTGRQACTWGGGAPGMVDTTTTPRDTCSRTSHVSATRTSRPG